jgi:serine protease Do
MSNTVAGGVTALAVALTMAAAMPVLNAQVRDRIAPWPPQMMMPDGGSRIGVAVRELTSDEIARARLAQPGGVLVEEVRDDSAASRAGLMKGDIVVEFDGERVRGVRDFTRLVRETPPGRGVTANIVRAGSRRDLAVTLDADDRLVTAMPDMPRLNQQLRALPQFGLPEDLDPTPDLKVTPRGQIGITLAPLTEQLAAYFGVNDGVLVSSVMMDSAAAHAGIKAGDVIVAVDGRPARNVADVTRAVRTAKPGTALDVRLFRDKKEIGVKVAIPTLITEPPSVQPV